MKAIIVGGGSLALGSVFSLAAVGMFSLVLGGVGMGCSPSTTKQVREHTYPPEMIYVADEQVREAMISLANGVMIIEAAKDDPYPTVMIVDALKDMRRAAVSLATPSTRVVTPPIDANMGRLLRDIDEALIASSKNLPNHVRAEALPGSCLYCHHQRVAVSR